MTGNLGHFSQLLEETEHFFGWRQEKVAKIVQCGEPDILNKHAKEATRKGGLSFCLSHHMARLNPNRTTHRSACKVLSGGAQRKLLIRTTSLLVVPRPQTSDLPSRDQSKAKKVSEVKWVNCFGGLPSSG